MSRRRFAQPRRGNTAHVFIPSLLASDLRALRNYDEKFKRIAKSKSVAGGPKDFSAIVQAGLEHLAKKTWRRCAVEGCKGTPMYQFYSKFWCAKHREESLVAVREHNEKKYTPKEERKRGRK